MVDYYKDIIKRLIMKTDYGYSDLDAYHKAC